MFFMKMIAKPFVVFLSKVYSILYKSYKKYQGELTKEKMGGGGNVVLTGLIISRV